ncbi:MAG: hypothetical protein DWQ28_10230, partial [Proteobacteria bacterium]
MHKWVLASLVSLLLASCTTSPPTGVTAKKGAASDYPIPMQRLPDAGDIPDSGLNREAVLWAENIAAESG